MNANSEQKLRDGVTWHNPEGIPASEIPEGQRFLTSVETGIPRGSSLTFCPSRRPVLWAPLGDDSGFCPTRHPITYITKAPLPATALPVVEPELPAGVSWLGNPLEQADLDAGWRRLCSAEERCPGGMEFLSSFHQGWVGAGVREGTLNMVRTLKPPFTFSYRTKAPLPAFTPEPATKPVEHTVNLVRTPGESTRVVISGSQAVFTADGLAPEKPVIWNIVPRPASEPLKFPELPKGVSWIGVRFGGTPDFVGVSEGWRPLCTLDETIPADAQFVLGGVWTASGDCGKITRHIGATLRRTKQPIPAVPKLEFPALPAGVGWVNLGNLTPADIGVGDGWRPLCTLDKVVPADAETFKGFPKTWKPSGKRGERPVSPYVAYRTKAPIPQPTWPELPAGEEYLNPQGLKPADLGFGYRPLCTLDEWYPTDHEYRSPLLGGWKSGMPCSRRPSGTTFGKTYRTKQPVPTKPATITGPISTAESSAVYPDSDEQRRIATLTAELNAAKEEVRKAGESLVSFACKTTDYQSALYQILQLTGGPATVEEVGCDIAAVALARVIAQKSRLEKVVAEITDPRSSEIELRNRVTELERQNQYMRDSRSNIIKTSAERRHALDEINRIIEGTLDPSHVHLSATARKVAAEVKKLRTKQDNALQGLSGSADYWRAVGDNLRAGHYRDALEIVRANLA